MANSGETITKTTEERISTETRRLRALFKDLDENKKKAAQTLIARAAFLTVSLQDLEKDLAANGWTEEYQNGENQSGVKKAAAADVHISLTRNLSTIMKQLMDLVPAAPKKKKNPLDILKDE